MNFLSKYRVLYYSAIISIPLAVILGHWHLLLLGFVYFKLLHLFGTQIGLHRYFCHRGFTTSRTRHFFLLSCSVLCGQGSPITWTALHLHHHANSDTDSDVHSPSTGFINSVLLWPIKQHNLTLPSPKYLIRDSAIVFTHKNYFIIWYSLVIITAIINPLITVYFLLMPAGLSLIHANLFTNYLPHRSFLGNYRNYNTLDNSYNNKFISYYQWGEGLHNNHHKSMSNYNQAHKPDELDIAAYVIERLLKTN